MLLFTTNATAAGGSSSKKSRLILQQEIHKRYTKDEIKDLHKRWKSEDVIILTRNIKKPQAQKKIESNHFISFHLNLQKIIWNPLTNKQNLTQNSFLIKKQQ